MGEFSVKKIMGTVVGIPVKAVPEERFLDVDSDGYLEWHEAPAKWERLLTKLPHRSTGPYWLIGMVGSTFGLLMPAPPAVALGVVAISAEVSAQFFGEEAVAPPSSNARSAMANTVLAIAYEGASVGFATFVSGIAAMAATPLLTPVGGIATGVLTGYGAKTALDTAKDAIVLFGYGIFDCSKN